MTRSTRSTASLPAESKKISAQKATPPQGVTKKATSKAVSKATAKTVPELAPKLDTSVSTLPDNADIVEQVNALTIAAIAEPNETETAGISEAQTPVVLVSSSAYKEFEAVFARWKATEDPILAQALRHQLILMYRNLVVSLARRFLERGEMFDDIVQQGLIGLIYALDHFEPARGVRFTTFATPAILGEIRRYFRDKSWGIRVPRRMQELHQTINRSMEQLTQQYGRVPTYAEIANALNLPEDDIIEVVEMAHSVDPVSLDEPTSSESGYNQTTLSETLGENDPDLQRWHDWSPLQAALDSLPDRQRRVMHGIYFQGRSQVEIARDLNVSQMYVSRAQRRALAKLKEILREGEM